MAGRHVQTLVEHPELEHEDPHEAEVLRELIRMGIENDPIPDECPECHCRELTQQGGCAGETVVICMKCDRVVWEDHEDAIRRVF